MFGMCIFEMEKYPDVSELTMAIYSSEICVWVCTCETGEYPDVNEYKFNIYAINE